MAELLIYGAGGHGWVVAESAQAAGWQIRGFLDDSLSTGPIGPWDLLDKSILEKSALPIHVAIGHNAARRLVSERLLKAGKTLATVIHPSAWISPTSVLGDGVYVGPQASVNAQARLGRGVIVNTAAVVEHHTIISPFAHLGPGSILTGQAEVREETLLGAGCVVLPKVRVGARVTVAAGAVVLRDVPADQTVMGVPAKPVPPKPSTYSRLA
ncbi:MAG: acetyltransferase [Phycisphaeraceae bacterium]|nr:acetyltransferase [Phycisphaeraceae bacterium]